MTTPVRVVILEDNSDDVRLMVHELRQAGFAPMWRQVATESEYAAQMSDNPDIILADYSLPQFDALRALALLQAKRLDIPFIVVTGTIGEESVVECIKRGATDYLLKDRLTRLGSAVTHALQEKTLREEKLRAEEARREEVRISLALARVGQALIASLDTPTILDRLCQLTTEVLGCDASHTFLWQPKEKAYIPAAGYGDTPEQREAMTVLKVPCSFIPELLAYAEHDEVVQIMAAETHGLIPLPLLRQFGVTTALCVALRRGNEFIGVQTASSRGQEKPFTDGQKRIMGGIGQLASLALNNARLLEQAQSASQLKSDFLATISHELRTPLNIILGYTDLLLEGEFDPLTAQQQKILRHVDKSTRELFERLTATLDASRLENGRLPLKLEALDVPTLIAAVEVEVESYRQEKPALSLHWQVDPELPALWTDREKMKLVLRNLVHNALKFTDAGSVSVTVTAHPGSVEFRVSDTGIGIAPNVIPMIFDLFRQGDSSMTRRHEGLGLGLYLVKRMLDLLGGTIVVDSEVGCGSIFRVWIPATARTGEGDTRGDGSSSD